MKRLVSAAITLGLALGLGVLCSCIGIRSDIVLNPDGTGRISLEYRVSRQFEAIGALDGSRPLVPLGRADFERGIGRMEGLRLNSFSSTGEGDDLVTRAVITFSRLEDILPLLDSGSRTTVLYREGDRQVLRVHLGSGETRQNPDPELLALADQASEGYGIAVSLSAPGAVELRVKGDREGLTVEESGKKAGFSAALSRFFRPGKDLDLEFVF
jgi:hypothetical protein